MKNIFVILISILLLGCGANKKVANQKSNENLNQLTGSWELHSMDGTSLELKDPITISFENNQVSGSLGCNQMNGSYTISQASSINFKQLSTTRMMCEPALMDIESKLLQYLENSTLYVQVGDMLILNGKGTELQFKKMNNNDITGKYWKLKILNGDKVELANNQEKEQYFTLHKDGKINGYGGCNVFQGNYEITDDHILNVGHDLKTTLQLCPDNDFPEAEFLSIFGQPSRFEIKGDTLNLYDQNDKLKAEFEAVYF